MTDQHDSQTTPSTTTTHSKISQTTIANLRFEHLKDTLGIGTDRPRLSWTIETTTPNWRQRGYELEVYTTDGELKGQTGLVDSEQSVLVPWPFEPLHSREGLSVRLRIHESNGQHSDWSALYSVEAGLLSPDDWSARFVTPDWEEDTSQPGAHPLLRHEFDVQPGLKQARLYVTALGLYESHLNGTVIGDHTLAPGWTSYTHRLRYQTFDVTSHLHEGRNAIGAMLGDGWYRGRLGFNGGQRNHYGDQLALLAQLELTYEDGTTERVVTDPSWHAARGPILASGIYDGETYDARQDHPGWSTPGHDDHDWFPVRSVERDLNTLVAPTGPAVRRVELVTPLSITTSPSGRTIIDFGQNLVGRLRLTVRGEAGQTITLRHAEVLEDGELCTRLLRHAQATDHYTLRGGDTETWEPRFTFHGFRYAEVEGWPGELQLDNLRAVVCHSDMERIGWFECSNSLLNQLHSNVIWSMRGNFVDIPTDCPQRDERMGWTGDIQVFSPTASFLYNTAGFLTSWLADVAFDQADAGGVVPFVVPNLLDKDVPPAAAWGDAGVVVPWVLYQRSGDAGILATQFASMRAWVDTIAERAGSTRLWNTGFQYGDWLDPRAPAERADDARTDKYLIATAYFAYSSELLSQAAQVLGDTENAERYSKLAQEVRVAFNREYVTPGGRVLSDSTTAYALALQFNLLETTEHRQRAGKRLAELVRESGYHISTGFVGTPLICDALCAAGEEAVAYRLLMQTECPSWLYPVTQGATTIWERWDCQRPDGTINTSSMTSFNHYALGAVADWLHRTVAGLAPAEPGYRRITIQPRPGSDLTHASAQHRTPYGLSKVAWRLEDDKLSVEAVIPPNTTAHVVLPGRESELIEVGSGSYHWTYEYQQQKG
ncbi:glycoside hydrolase family 78 protein [Ktedonospora formicarum]|uniref:alpha-L-rhamnosidase n=1 Tax=Ktedonospora formicarum TaxID=2778364 RepID=A0A8J3I4Z4_9CHLR|nr:glycoside hydrolase family 78 protein [Ktedonospora formicarum]GHO46755.1 alpha-L-rhamnosidase [Ktedonospora formicarum]